MNPIEFKNVWLKNNTETWAEFSVDELENSNLNNETKEFLKIGFPESAAPFLDFGLISFDGKLFNVSNYYSEYNLNEKTKYFWIIGFENSGNLICVDALNNDKIILLDHEQEFEVIEIINSNIFDLAKSLLLYKNFIEKVNSEFGKDGYINKKYNKSHVIELEKEFDKNLIISTFWESEIKLLMDNVK